MRRGVKTYNKWKDSGLLEELTEEDGFKLAHYFEEAYELVKDDGELTGEISTFFPIVRRLFMKNNNLNIKETYNILSNYYQSIEYKRLKTELLHDAYFAIDVEAELTTYISENYEEIKENQK